MKLQEKITETYRDITLNETEQGQKLAEDPLVDFLVDLCHRWMQRHTVTDIHAGNATYNAQTDIRAYVRQKQGTLAVLSQDLVTRVAFGLERLRDDPRIEIAGAFLSALIYETMRETGERRYDLPLLSLELALVGIGDRNNGAEIHILGNAGDYLASAMKAGSVYVEGDVLYSDRRLILGSVGERMRGGNVFIQGSVMPSVGHCMYGGMVTIEGDCNGEIGMQMEGGTVIVKGDLAKKVSEFFTGGSICVEGAYAGKERAKKGVKCRGRIYHRGEQVYPKPTLMRQKQNIK